MAKSHEVLRMLIPQGGWATTGDSFKDVLFIDCEPISKAEFEAGFAEYDSWKQDQESAKAEAKASVLERLGITADEAALLLG
jgi:hypothetical protein